jgi:hypothetical protein
LICIRDVNKRSKNKGNEFCFDIVWNAGNGLFFVRKGWFISWAYLDGYFCSCLEGGDGHQRKPRSVTKIEKMSFSAIPTAITIKNANRYGWQYDSRTIAITRKMAISTVSGVSKWPGNFSCLL